jgi:two-component system chemotaxis response regulator CheB
LSGELDDGTSGLDAIKRCGGITLVQHPESTTYSMMLDVALTNVGADRVLHPHELLPVLRELIATPAPEVPPPPADLIAEARMATGTQALTTDEFAGAAPTSLSCPECGGPLWERASREPEFRCLVGHAYQLEALQNDADAALERTLWAAIRQFEQRANIARMMANQSRHRDQKVRAALHESRAKEAQEHAQRLRELQARYRNGSE